MKRTLKNFILSTSVLAGMGALLSSPAFAVTFSVSGDNLYYESNGTNTFLGGTNVTSVDLTGNSLAPGNNLELGGNTSNNNTVDFLNATTMTGTIGGNTITFSSLTADDWFGTGNTTSSYGANDFANQWFNAALDAYDFDGLLTTANQFSFFTGVTFEAQATKTTLFNTFLVGGGFQRASDPNISYVNLEGDQVNIGLAGHYSLNNEILAFLNNSGLGSSTDFISSFIPLVQLSEVVKINYGGQEGLYSNFGASKSGQFELGDGKSHNGNYEITLAAAPSGNGNTAGTPEPVTILGSLTAAVVMVAARRKKKS